MKPPVYRIDPAAPRHATVIHALQRNAATVGARDGIVVAATPRAPGRRACAARSRLPRPGGPRRNSR